MQINGKPIVSLAAVSSPDFLRQAFEFYRSGQVFAVVRDDVADDPRLTGSDQVSLGEESSSGWFQTDYKVSHTDDPAQIVFSSGTEGRPKAIVLTHANLGNVVERLNRTMQVTGEIREYVGVPVTYSFGLGRVRAVMAAGGAVYIPEAFNPLEFKQMLEAGEVNALSVVPSLCRILLKASDLFRDVGKHVRWIEIGS